MYSNSELAARKPIHKIPIFCPWLKAEAQKAITKSASLERENSNFLRERLGQEVFCLFREGELDSCQAADWAVCVFLGRRYTFITGTSPGWYFISSRVRRCAVNIVGMLEKVPQDSGTEKPPCRSVFPSPARAVCAAPGSSFYTTHSTLHSLVTGRKLKTLSYDHSVYSWTGTS